MSEWKFLCSKNIYYFEACPSYCERPLTKLFFFFLSVKIKFNNGKIREENSIKNMMFMDFILVNYKNNMFIEILLKHTYTDLINAEIHVVIHSCFSDKDGLLDHYGLMSWITHKTKSKVKKKDRQDQNRNCLPQWIQSYI